MSSDFTIDLNSIIVVESIDGEVKTGHLLYDTLISEFEKIDAFYGNTEYKECNGKEELLQFFENLVVRVRSGLRPMIHIECHSDELGKGLILTSGEFVAWSELYDYLREINIIMKNSLFLNMGVCEGGKIQEIVDIEREAPFFCLIGSLETIWNTEIFEGFVNFYKAILVDKNILLGMTNIKSNTNFKCWSLEKIFRCLYKLFVADKENGGYEKTANRVIAQVELEQKKSIALDVKANMIIECRKELLNSYNKIILNTRDKFLMIDRYPEIITKYIDYNEWKFRFEEIKPLKK